MNQEITTHRIGGLELVLLVSNTMTIMAGATIAPFLPEMSRVFQATPNSEVLCKLVLTVPSLIYCYRCTDYWSSIGSLGTKTRSGRTPSLNNS